MNDSDACDGLDQRIVAAIQINPRAGVAEVGRILGEHERMVARRVQRLLSAGTIRCTADYDPLYSGLGRSVHLRLRTAMGCPENIPQGLAKLPGVLNVAAVSGGAGLLWCHLLAEGRPRLPSQPLKEMPGLHDATVLSAHVTLRPFRTEAEWHAPVLTEEEEKRLRASLVQPLPGPARRHDLTPTDRRVADVLTRNARISLTDLGKELGFSTATAGRRVASLLERRVLRLRTVADPAVLGRPVEARVRLKVHPAGIEAVGAALSRCPEVSFCAAVTGCHNILANVCVEDETSLYGFIVGTLGALPHILDCDTEILTHVSETHASEHGSAATDAP
ncbi:Lrp/AsnC family transcriptional regulator [Kitasatospora sp. SUK 42]|uniref:Lrp/AsnC family transcriptional regulator n=1 Tax=Kitasatospora sp. SUK 42 TaxID=1588882 RepID=UPI001C317FAE|nr:Lrp/AsnC family transcriptional regulator [Kitasatospora sp. SUK 42]MBV2155318.1 Lrp/AsnC family transcriptional regulator [Kitasatospora sp. SUK 42]